MRTGPVVLLVVLVLTAGCLGIGGEQPPETDVDDDVDDDSQEDDGGEDGNGNENETEKPSPEIRNISLLSGPGTIGDLDQEIDSVEVPDDAYPAVVYDVPRENGSFNATVEMTILRNGTTVAQRNLTDSGTVSEENTTRYAWLTFDTVEFEAGEHSVRVNVTDNINGTWAQNTTTIEVQRPLSDEEIERLAALDAWADGVAREAEGRGLNVTATDTSVGFPDDRITLTVELDRDQRLEPAAAEIAHAFAMVTEEVQSDVQDPHEPADMRVEFVNEFDVGIDTFNLETDQAEAYISGDIDREEYADTISTELQKFSEVETPAVEYLRAAELGSYADSYAEMAGEGSQVQINETYVDVDEDAVYVEATWPSDNGSAHAAHTRLISAHWRTLLVTPELNHPESGVEFYLHNERDSGEGEIGTDARAFVPTEGASDVAEADPVDRFQAGFDFRGTVFDQHFESLIEGDVTSSDPVEDPYDSDDRSLQD